MLAGKDLDLHVATTTDTGTIFNELPKIGTGAVAPNETTRRRIGTKLAWRWLLPELANLAELSPDELISRIDLRMSTVKHLNIVRHVAS